MVKPLFENCVSFIYKMHLPGYKFPWSATLFIYNRRPKIRYMYDVKSVYYNRSVVSFYRFWSYMTSQRNPFNLFQCVCTENNNKGLLYFFFSLFDKLVLHVAPCKKVLSAIFGFNMSITITLIKFDSYHSIKHFQIIKHEILSIKKCKWCY